MKPSQQTLRKVREVLYYITQGRTQKQALIYANISKPTFLKWKDYVMEQVASEAKRASFTQHYGMNTTSFAKQVLSFDDDLVEAFEVAVRKHEMKGSKEPETHKEIERNYKIAKLALVSEITQLNKLLAIYQK